jgi:hypothetical protein
MSVRVDLVIVYDTSSLIALHNATESTKTAADKSASAIAIVETESSRSAHVSRIRTGKTAILLRLLVGSRR